MGGAAIFQGLPCLHSIPHTCQPLDNQCGGWSHSLHAFVSTGGVGVRTGDLLLSKADELSTKPLVTSCYLQWWIQNFLRRERQLSEEVPGYRFINFFQKGSIKHWRVKNKQRKHIFNILWLLSGLNANVSVSIDFSFNMQIRAHANWITYHRLSECHVMMLCKNTFNFYNLDLYWSKVKVIDTGYTEIGVFFAIWFNS